MYQAKIEELLKELTLEEKASLCSGFDFWTTKRVTRLGIPPIAMADGPHGLRKEIEDDDNVAMKSSFPATAFPTAVNLASTWNPALVYDMGQALADQCVDQKVSTILGPGTNIKRSPLCSRNFEYFSEDPYLAGRFCVEYIKGVQSKNIGTSLKHFAANNQEYLRYTINSLIDERTLRELYLPQFETAVKEAQPWTVMCSYNKLNNVQVSDNKRLLTEILRDEWGFEGIVVTDWNALGSRVPAIKAGCDLEMPSSGGRTDNEIVRAVESGELEPADLDRVVARLLEYIFKSHESTQINLHADYKKHHKLAKKIADESIVLLKNERNLLPIRHPKQLGIIGALAKESRYQGSGSSRINPYYLVNFVDELNYMHVPYLYADGYSLTHDTPDDKLIAEAVETAKKCDAIVLFVGLTDNYENEGVDRQHMRLPTAHNVLAEAILEANPNAVIILQGGAPVELPWLEKAPCILNSYLAGEAVGASIFDIIFGLITPSGKLAETYPYKLGDVLSSKYFGMGPKNVEHREGIFIGYRYFDTAEKEVAFPFGHGLSYTTFEYSGLKLSKKSMRDDETLEVTFTVTNTGEREGAEAAQVYVKDKVSTAYMPEKQLFGFKKVYLKPGESETVTVALEKRAFAYYNIDIKDWHVESGEFEIMVGASSRDIKLFETVNVTSTLPDVKVPDLRELTPVYYDLKGVEEIPQEQFKTLFDFEFSENRYTQRGEFTRDTTVGELRQCIPGKIVVKIAPKLILGQMPNVDFTTMLLMKKVFEQMPLRALNGVTTGLLDIQVVDGLILWANKKRIKGLLTIIKGLLSSLGNIKSQNREREINREKKRLKDAEKQKIEQLKREIEEKTEELRRLELEKDDLKEQEKELKDAHKETVSEIKLYNKEVLKEIERSKKIGKEKKAKK